MGELAAVALALAIGFLTGLGLGLRRVRGALQEGFLAGRIQERLELSKMITEINAREQGRERKLPDSVRRSY